jgi:hypothetical protein
MKRSIAICLILAFGGMPAFSMSHSDSVPPGNWAKVESLVQNTEISVKMLFGDKMEGKYLGLDPDVIRVNIGGEERLYPRKDIAEIHIMNINDSNQNGVGIGVLAGAAALGIWGGVAAKDVTSDAGTAALALVGAGLGAGIGGLIGYLVDNMNKGSELIYRAPNSN